MGGRRCRLNAPRVLARENATNQTSQVRHPVSKGVLPSYFHLQSISSTWERASLSSQTFRETFAAWNYRLHGSVRRLWAAVEEIKQGTSHYTSDVGGGGKGSNFYPLFPEKILDSGYATTSHLAAIYDVSVSNIRAKMPRHTIGASCSFNKNGVQL